MSAFLFSISILLSFLLQLNLPSATGGAVLGLNSLVLTYVIASVPFFFSGICVCVALTGFPEQVSKLYAADLIGSAAGCILLIQVLKVTDAPTAVIIVATIACIASLFFAAEGRLLRMKLATLFCSFLFIFFAAWHVYLLVNETPVLRLKWVKGKREPETYLYERWNSFSRVTVSGNPYVLREPFGWGLSSIYASYQRVQELKMEIDGTAGTILTGFDGDLQRLNYLRYDITNLAHYIRPDSKVLVIGVGGGRDILSALAFKQKSVTGIEMNDAIVSAVNEKFGDFTGHLDRNPRVRFVSDEARSWIARQPNKFDIIQLSLIDTWAATSAGAFVLAENSLYTVEAWKTYFDHLSPDGILTVSRWYHRLMPGEMYRLTSLAAATLEKEGVKNPRRHMLIARRMASGAGHGPDGVGTLLVSKRPFTEAEIDTIENVVNALGFEIVLSPERATDPSFQKIASPTTLGFMLAEFPINITPPTDNSPFFFNMLHLHDAFIRGLWEQGNVKFNMEAVFVLVELLLIVITLTFLFLILPLILKKRKTSLKGSFPLFLYFAGIGFGFMLIEISQMQRLIILLGHPTYGISVVLFSLLLSSGLGSYLTSRFRDLTKTSPALLALLLTIAAAYGILTPHIIDACETSSTPIRILAAIGILFPLGIFMGMAFPIGMKTAADKWGHITPWFWAINGTTSVTASVLAIAISMNWTISTAFWTGFAWYGLSFAALAWLQRLRLLEWIRRNSGILQPAQAPVEKCSEDQ
jgi:hypothetical protein